MQVIARLGNSWIAKVRVASHLISILMIGVRTAFCVIKYAENLLDEGTVAALALLGMLVFAVLLAEFFMFMQCSLLGELDDSWKTFKQRMVKGSRRN